MVMALINWHPSFSINIEEIDKQHQLLVKMINDLYDAMNAGKEKAILEKMIGRLNVYAAMHFAKEEHYFDMFGYPETESHKKEHSDFEEKVLKFENDFNDGSQNLSAEIVNFLGDWLVGHIKGSDKKYALFLNERGIQ
jgi:hemerythrin-like metal-binding protein